MTFTPELKQDMEDWSDDKVVIRRRQSKHTRPEITILDSFQLARQSLSFSIMQTSFQRNLRTQKNHQKSTSEKT